MQSNYTFFQFRLYHTVVLCAWRFTAALEVAWPRNGESQNGSAKSMLRPPPWGHGLIRHFSLKILIVKSVKMQPWWWTKGFSSRYVVICFMVAKAAAAKFFPNWKAKKILSIKLYEHLKSARPFILVIISWGVWTFCGSGSLWFPS